MNKYVVNAAVLAACAVTMLIPGMIRADQLKLSSHLDEINREAERTQPTPVKSRDRQSRSKTSTQNNLQEVLQRVKLTTFNAG
jgi:hypothetical protein